MCVWVCAHVRVWGVGVRVRVIARAWGCVRVCERELCARVRKLCGLCLSVFV